MLSLLLDFFEKLLLKPALSDLLAITESSEIEKVKQIRIQELLEKSSMKTLSFVMVPQNCIYDADI